MDFNLDFLKNILEERKISQAELARMTGYTRGYINQIVNDHRMPTLENIRRLSDALNIQPELLSRSFSNRFKFESNYSNLSRYPKFYIELLRVAMKSLGEAQSAILDSYPANLLASAEGKEDTLTFDAKCEIIIVKKLKEFMPECAVLTEERIIRGIEYINDLCWILDPVDRSDQLKVFLELAKNGDSTFRSFLKDPEFHKHKLDPLNNPTGSITCILKGKILFSLILDFITGEIYASFDSKAKFGNLEDYGTPEDLLLKGEDLLFEKREFLGDRNPIKEGVCYLGKEVYQELFEALGFKKHHQPANPQYHKPGGPARILFLSNITQYKPLFILSNGEKISEFIAWISFALASKDLVIYELTPKGYKNFIRYGVIMAPPKYYTALKTTPSVESGVPAEVSLDMSKLTNLDIPCNFRSAILITHINNDLFNAELRVSKNARELYPNRIAE